MREILANQESGGYLANEDLMGENSPQERAENEPGVQGEGGAVVFAGGVRADRITCLDFSLL